MRSAGFSFHQRVVRALKWYIHRTFLLQVVKSFCRLTDRRALARRQAQAGELSSSLAVDALARKFNVDGFVKLDDIVDTSLLEDLNDVVRERLVQLSGVSANQSETHKTFWTRLLDDVLIDGKLISSSPFVRFAVQCSILNFMQRVFGESPLLDSIYLTLSRHTTEPFSYSQLWHFDYDDTRVVRLFVYLTDVPDSGAGPFTLLPAPLSSRLGWSMKSRRNDSEVKRNFGEHINIVLGKKLSVFAVETSRCLHMGSRLERGRERILYTATFVPPPRLPWSGASRFRMTGTETAIERAVLEG